MKPNTTTKQVVARLLAALMLLVSLQSATAQAAMVSTSELVAAESQSWQRAQVSALLAEQEAVNTLESLGIDPEMVQQRVDNMTAAELQAFNQQVADQQAGGSSLLGVVVLIFVVLVVLDLLGTTNVFPAIKQIES